MTDTPRVPPWHMYPQLPAGHIGWRMGDGEQYLNEWQSWLFALPETDRRAYLRGLESIPPGWRELVVELYAHPNNQDDDDVYDAAHAALFGARS